LEEIAVARAPCRSGRVWAIVLTVDRPVFGDRESDRIVYE
jgi:hypothetical protein